MTENNGAAADRSVELAETDDLSFSRIMASGYLAEAIVLGGRSLLADYDTDTNMYHLSRALDAFEAFAEMVSAHYDDTNWKEYLIINTELLNFIDGHRDTIIERIQQHISGCEDSFKAMLEGAVLINLEAI